jgi:hypothetical protein
MMTKGRVVLMLAIGVCALAASAAPALAVNGYEPYPNRSPFDFAGGNPEKHVFTFGSVTAECKVAEFTGSQPAPATTVKEVPKYSECKMLGSTATVTVTSCEYQLLEPMGGPTSFKANMRIVNDGSSCEIAFVTAHCTVKIAAEEPELEYLEEEYVAPGATKVYFKVQKIGYSHSGTTCTGIGSGSDGTYKGPENIEQLTIY